jgi:hypothetical protein
MVRLRACPDQRESEEVLSRFLSEHLQLTLSVQRRLTVLGCCVAAFHPLRTQKLVHMADCAHDRPHFHHFRP